MVDDAQRSDADRGFQKAAVAGSKPITIKEPVEYKLSGKRCSVTLSAGRGASPWGTRRVAVLCATYTLTVWIEINDIGVYLPVRLTFPFSSQSAGRSLGKLTDFAPALTYDREAQFLALEIQCLDHVLQPQESVE